VQARRAAAAARAAPLPRRRAQGSARTRPRAVRRPRRDALPHPAPILVVSPPVSDAASSVLAECLFIKTHRARRAKRSGGPSRRSRSCSPRRSSCSGRRAPPRAGPRWNHNLHNRWDLCGAHNLDMRSRRHRPAPRSFSSRPTSSASSRSFSARSPSRLRPRSPAPSATRRASTGVFEMHYPCIAEQ